ncbi:MlaD family protein [Actinomycetospora sp. TBRC 11914]|uniref:MlaD family protein n=1 Tax=Actinomycetospora sp. TBRC 11914 TaxID=2729387 RepID=UPI00145E2C42|nr:MlaD family protein [Actinomycetospora sp. TBRC 11914]NMO91477.1 MCE family protein [Actinomycetospora sp. TBRC 11914]
MAAPSRRVVTVVLGVLAVVVAVAGIVTAVTAATAPYRLQVVMPSALGLTTGTPVQLAGRDAGTITGLDARGDQAIATVELPTGDSDVPLPLHAGTVVRVESRSVLGERFLAVDPGPATAAALPDDALIPAGSAQVTLEDVLDALDPATRSHLASTVRELDGTLHGREDDANQMLETAGPTVDALGAVLDAVGDDGPAIRELVTNAHQVTQVLAQRRGAVAGTVRDLGTLTDAVATRQQQLSDGLAELPGALDATRNALDKVPDATDAADPLLDDLRPAADRLPGVAGDLRSVLGQLQPTLAQLKPTLQAANALLGDTPGLLDRTHHTVPQLTEAVQRSAPAVAFLRPYAPETAGFLGNWGNFFSSYDSTGHVARALFTGGQTTLNEQPPAPPVGGVIDRTPAPGAAGGQPWTDANGDAAR